MQNTKPQCLICGKIRQQLKTDRTCRRALQNVRQLFPLSFSLEGNAWMSRCRTTPSVWQLSSQQDAVSKSNSFPVLWRGCFILISLKHVVTQKMRIADADRNTKAHLVNLRRCPGDFEGLPARGRSAIRQNGQGLRTSAEQFCKVMGFADRYQQTGYTLDWSLKIMKSRWVAAQSVGLEISQPPHLPRKRLVATSLGREWKGASGQTIRLVRFASRRPLTINQAWREAASPWRPR